MFVKKTLAKFFYMLYNIQDTNVNKGVPLQLYVRTPVIRSVKI